MCGIAGIINFKGKPVTQIGLETMLKKMKHRGPDDEGTYIDDNIGFGFVRLSILDLSKLGHQPMLSHNKRYCIVFNGEVYNYIELKKELSSKYNFISGTDTEVVLAAYQEWGKSCLERFNGMFAFAIFDIQEKTIFIARDRFGIKPLYYYQDEDTFIFASDIPPILSVWNKNKSPDYQIVYDYLLLNRTQHSNSTFFEKINKLQHGHKILVKNGSVKIKRWYYLNDNIKDPFKNPDEFRELLLDSVKLQLRSDVPVGTCLSGGMDSSTITSLICKFLDKPDLHTFSAVYQKGQRGDESEFINEYAGQIQNMHFTKPGVDSFFSDMNDYIEALVEPIPDTSVYAEFKVMELAKKNCTVILNGQGADEEMAGYLYFFGYHFRDLLRTLRLQSFIKESLQYYYKHRSMTGFSYLIFALFPGCLKNFSFQLKNSYVSDDFFSDYKPNRDIITKFYSAKSLNKFLINHFEYKFEHHLLWADKSGMWFSLETRFPFLDHRFVEKILAHKSNDIIQNGITKVILRKAMNGILPDKITNRFDKVGYETPEDSWFRTEKFKSFIFDIINSESFINRGVFDYKKINILYNKHLDNKINIGQDVWKWIHLELWFRKFIDN